MYTERERERENHSVEYRQQPSTAIKHNNHRLVSLHFVSPKVLTLNANARR